jgi:deazaflavin-dependent oxidoreductase (nitroreductase family)
MADTEPAMRAEGGPMTELVIPKRNESGAIETEQARSPSSPDSSRQVLVVVDEPCTSPELCTSIRNNGGSSPTDALVVAPTHGSAATRWYVDEDAAREDATDRLRACVARLRAEGIRAEGRLGDPDPVQAITDALHVFAADEIQIITAPQRHSTWLHQNVIDRARHSFEQPIKHVVMPTTQGVTQARPRHIRANHGAAVPSAATTPRHGAGHSGLWKRFVARAGRGLQLLWPYRLGWLAGHSLLVLTHVGRRTGRQRRTVLYVQRYDRQTHEATVVSVWGESQWLRNIRAHPAVGVEIALQRYVPEQRFLSTDEIFAIEKRFRRRHRIIAWGQAKLMGWPWPATDEQLLELSAQLRGVTFRPVPTEERQEQP